MKILLIENDLEINELLAEILTIQGYSVDIATDGEKGWANIQMNNYDLILLDVILPKLDGISLCAKLRSQGYQMPIMVVTAKDTLEDQVLALDAGADDYLVKPYTIEELLVRVRALLRGGNCGSYSTIKVGFQLSNSFKPYCS